MTTRLLRKLMLFGILATFVLAMTPPVVMAFDGPEPGPPGATVPYTFVPPPFVGENMDLWLAKADPGDPLDSLFVSGTASQVGNPDCTLVFEDVLIAGYEDLLAGGFIGISCAELKPRDFIGNSIAIFSVGVILSCEDISPELGWYIDIMGVGNIVCVEDPGTGQAMEGTARIVLILSKPKL